MRVYFLRHGRAGQHGDPRFPDDSLRPLTDDGAARLNLICRGLEYLEPAWEIILTSPYTRARQTAEIVAEYFGVVDRLQEVDVLAPGHATRELTNILHDLPVCESVLLVGHEPSMSTHISNYVFGKPNANIILKKAGVACVVFDGEPGVGQGSLDFLMAPRQLMRLGKRRKAKERISSEALSSES